MNASATTHGDVQANPPSVGANASELVGKVKDAAQETLNQVKESSSHYYEAGKKGAVALERNLEELIQEHPIKAVLIAAGAGLLVGIVWKLAS